MKVPMFKTPAEQMVKSKGMIGGAIVFCVGIYIIVKLGNVTEGMAAIGFGFSLMGIRDAK